MKTIRRAFALVAAFLWATAALAATTSVVTLGTVDLYRGSTRVAGYATLPLCRAAAEAASQARGASGNYGCRQYNQVAVTYTPDAPPPPPPAAVDCAVSAWTEAPGAWSACSAGTQTRTVVLNRTITTQPANGGAACPALTSTRVETQTCSVTPPPPPPPTSSAYPLYPSLDLNAIPWHTGAGAWGPRVPLQAAALPLTNRQVSVSSAAQFNQAASVAGTQITITAGWPQATNVNVTASDIDVVLPAGVTVGSIQLGSWPYTTPVQRVRIRAPSGQRGGLMGQYRDFELAADIVLDGIDINGAASFSGGRGGEDNQAFRPNANRMAVLNVRAISPGYIWLGAAKHVLIANSNFYHGGASRSAVGFVEGWGIRNTAGPFVIVDSRIEGTRYHNLRMQSVGGAGEVAYIARSTFVARAEGRTAWLWNNLGQGGRGQAAVFESNDVYTYSAPGCGLGTELSTADVDYSLVRNNRFFGAGSAVFGGNAAGWVGNSFAAWTNRDVPWSGPGDPRQVPLPSGFSLISGEGSCPGF